MTIVQSVDLTLSLDDVLSHQGGARGRPVKPAVARLTRECLEIAQEHKLFKPAVVYERLPLAKIEGDRLVMEGGEVFEGLMLAIRFAGASELVLAACTIGPKLDDTVQELHEADDDVRAFIIDGIGVSAMNVLGRETCSIVGNEVETEGIRASGALSPRLHGIPLDNQIPLHKLVQSYHIGMTLTDGLMMIPKKPSSMILGVGNEMAQWSKEQVCEWCNLGRTCAYRATA
jgi:hypothetical protein